MSDYSDLVPFQSGDVIKFQVADRAPAAGKPMLGPTHEKIYLILNIVAKNGDPLPQPVPLECGLYKNELPRGANIQWDGQRLVFDDLDPGKLWTATMKDGIPRVRKENRGRWIKGQSGAFIDGATLVVTDEAAPVLERQETNVPETAVPEPIVPQGLRMRTRERLAKALGR
ncbi:MAG: hypothetical protein SFW62_07350 [Alphaproteobacteria bacterium]|nr:hypothetical protein [Alphaproteobacteria bacterium]